MASIEDLAGAYINLRNEIEVREDAHKKSMEGIKGDFDHISNALLAMLNDQNLDSAKTAQGTVSRRVSTRYWTSDWEAMHNFLKDNDALYLLEKRISNKAMGDFLEENPDLMPMGLQSNRKYAVSVRKPTKV